MDLKEVLKFLVLYKKALLLSAVTGALAGIALYFLPFGFAATGSFYVNRTSESSARLYFTYEGYYSQQTALAYTNTVVALLESVDLRKKALEELGMPITSATLRKYGRNTEVRKAGPQLITLTTKGNTLDEARSTWFALSKVLVGTAAEINKNGDPTLGVSKVSAEPVLRKNFSSITTDAAGGALLVLGLTITALALKKYLISTGLEGKKKK